MIRKCILVARGMLPLFAAAFLSSPCVAREPYADFLRGLKQRRFGEQALDYLRLIAERPDLPVEMKETLDLERSKCLRLAAAEIADPEQKKSRLAEAKRLAEKFLTEHPQHPAAGSIYLEEADDNLVRAQNLLTQARAAPEPAAQDRLLAEARGALIATGRQYESAAAKLKERISGSPPVEPGAAATSPALRDELEVYWLEARFQRALVDYLLAGSHVDEDEMERVRLLKQAEAAFDSIYQEYRGKRISLVAHLWHGKVLEDLGDTIGAVDHYDEVLVAAPEGPDADLDLAPLFGMAQLSRMRLVAATAEPKAIIQEGDQWLKSHGRWQPTSYYQGVALETAKARLKAARKARETEKARLLAEAATALAAIAKVDTEFRQEAVALRREAVSGIGTGGALTFEECVGLADEATNERNWTEATKLYEQAGQIAAKAKNAKQQEIVRLRQAQLLYRQALAEYAGGQMDKVLELAGKVVSVYPTTATAEDASSLAVAAALQKFIDAKADAKAAALGQFNKVTDVVLDKWPQRPVGDDARIALAEVSLVKNDLAEALKQLGTVNEKSKRYPAVLQRMGQVRWKQFVDARKSPDAASRTAETESLRSDAIKHLSASQERQRASWQPGAEPMPPALFDTQLLLAEIHLEADDAARAAPYFEGLFTATKALNPKALDARTRRALVGTARVGVALGNADQTSQAVKLLASLSGDEPEPNAVLVELAKLIIVEINKQAAQAPPPAAGAIAPPVAGPLRDLQATLLDDLEARKEFTVEQLVFLGDTATNLGKDDKAKDLYERVLAISDRDPAARAAAGPAIPRIRAMQLSLLRNEGRLDEALKQADLLIAANPNALEPLMEKGNILQSLAERDPKRWDECIDHWTKLRLRLTTSRSRPPEYYEVILNVATGLFRQAKQMNNKDKSLDAEKMLKSTLIISPKLSGPDMVAKFKSLLEAVESFRKGAKP